MSELPRSVDFLLGDNGDEKFPRMATSGLLRQEEPVMLVTDLHAALTALAEFIPRSEVDADHLMRIEHAMSALEQWADCCSDLLDGVGVLLPRAVAILWSPEHDYLTELALAKDSVERALVALADVPGVDAAALWADTDPLVRAAVAFGHGAMCPSWDAREGYEDSSVEVRAAVESVVISYRSDEPGSEYACRCQTPSIESASVSKTSGERAMESSDSSFAASDMAEDSLGAERFEGLSAVIKGLRETEYYETDTGDALGKLVTLTQLAHAACELRTRCYEDGAKLGAYNDAFVNHDLGELVCGVVGSTLSRRLRDDEAEAAEELLDAVFWLFADSTRRYAPGDWVKRLGDAVLLLRRSHPAVRALADELISELPEQWREWLSDPEGDRNAHVSLTSSDALDVDGDEEEGARVGASILNFHQAMWLQEGDSPLSLSPERDEAEDPNSRIWGDQLDFELYLAEAWHARRTDDWSFFIPLVRRAASADLSERWSQPRAHALYNALNHLLLFGGDGQHPIAALGELLDWDDEYNHLGGFTNAFKECWKPVLLEMWLWWTRSGFAPHARAGTPMDWVDQDLFSVNEPNEFRFDDGDALHLSGHCGAPLGQHWTDSDRCETDGAEILRNEPTVVTVTVPTYRKWMAVLRTMTTSGPTIVKVMISDEEPPSGVTLGFWLVQKFEEPHPTWRNHVRFLTDATAPTALSLVRDWQWDIPGSDQDDEA